jgi:hypothetical protein
MPTFIFQDPVRIVHFNMRARIVHFFLHELFGLFHVHAFDESSHLAGHMSYPMDDHAGEKNVDQILYF